MSSNQSFSACPDLESVQLTLVICKTLLVKRQNEHRTSFFSVPAVPVLLLASGLVHIHLKLQV